MRVWVLSGCLLMLSIPAHAGPGEDKRACANAKLSHAKRIAACGRLIGSEASKPQERAVALFHRGRIYRWQEKWDAALADFAAALKLDPGNPDVLREQGYVYFNTDRTKLAAAAFSEAITSEPRRQVNYYYRARARVKLGQLDEALADYDKALVLDARYLDAYNGRARLHNRRKNYKAAVDDCNGALSISPYYAGAYAVRARAQEELGNLNAAVHDLGVALALNPNLEGIEPSLKRLKAVSAALPSGEPVPFKLPKEGLALTYLSTRRAKAKKSEADEMLGDLFGWFKKKRVPVPTRKRFLARTILKSEGHIVVVQPANALPLTDGKRVPPSLGYFYGLPADILPGPGGKVLEIVLEQAPFAKLWPLTVGATGTGPGKLEYVCPDPVDPQSQFLGCKKPGDRIPFGTTQWKGDVQARERVVTPAGVFEAVKIQFKESLTIEFMGRTNKTSSIVTWWYAPKLNWWVKRVRDVDGFLQIEELTAYK